MRVSMCSPPLNKLVASQCNVPFSLVATPFADPEGPIEKQVPLVKSADNSPVRCTRCRGYINCFVQVSADVQCLKEARWATIPLVRWNMDERTLSGSL